MSSRDHSVVGGWLGTYRYRGLESLRHPVRFEAVFKLSPDGLLCGEIIDDCALGEATVSVFQSGCSVTFSKCYVRGIRFETVGLTEYRGTLSDDGKSMRGTWQLHVRVANVLIARANGDWEARRMWHEAEDESSLSDRNESATSHQVVAVA